MKAMILCAGLGTRLRPLTDRWPKPTIPLLGQPLFRYTLATLKRAGIDSVGINTHHLGDEMKRVAEAECRAAQVSVETVHEPVLQGTAGGIRGLQRLLQDDVFVVWSGDILFDLELGPLIEQHRRSNAVATLLLLPMPVGDKYGAVEVDPEGRVKRLAGYGPGGDRLSPWHFTAVHIMSPAIFEFMAPSGPEDSVRHVYPRALAAGREVRGEVVRGYWSDLGTPARYLACQRDLLFRTVNPAAFGKASPFEGLEKVAEHVWKHPTARIDGKVSGPAFFDEGSVLSAGADVGSAVYLGKRSVVEPGARLNRVTVLEGSKVKAGEELMDAIVFGDQRIKTQEPR